MKQIEFRGKPTENNTTYFSKDDSVYGSLLLDNKKYYICLNVIENIDRDDYEVYMIEVIPETVGQYTGLKDKNGKKIFEGDIVDVTRPCIWERGIVILKNGCFFIKAKETLLPLFECEINNYKLEIIGNIYDNPELLEEEL